MSHPRGIPRARDLGRSASRSKPIAIPRAEGRSPHGVAQRQKARGEGGWTATRYEDREPVRGETRADEYHASRLFPNYKQFSRTRTGATMVDTLGREYQIADGIDRLEDQESGLILPGSPYLVEPSLLEGGVGGRSIVFSDMGGNVSVSSFTFTLSKEDEKRAAKDDPLVSQTALYPVTRGPQLLYVRIPIRERRNNPELSLPNVSDEIKLYHIATGSKARGIVREVDGFQFPRASTGSVRLDMLTFFIDTNRLAL